MSLPEVVLVASVAVSGILTIPHIYNLFRRDRCLLGDDSSDDSNETISSSKPPAAAPQRVILAVCGVAGTVTALSLALRTHAQSTQWNTIQVLHLAIWAVILFQELVLITRRKSQDRYSLGIYSATTCLILCATIGFVSAFGWQNQEVPMGGNLNIPLNSVQLCAAIVLAFTNVSIPRGPITYRNGKVIDRRNAVSFLSRYSFSWAQSTLMFAAKNGRLNADDLPLIQGEVRARTLYSRFAAETSTPQLWKQFLRIHWRALAAQTVFQLVAAGCHFLPQLLLFFILQGFEARDAGSGNQMELWLTAAGLGVALVLSSWSSAIVFWIADVNLSLPVHEQLFTVLINKILRMKDVVVSSQEGSADDDDDGETDGDDEDQPKTRQSILNLLGVDAESISNFAKNHHDMLDAVFELMLAIAFLLKLMGWKPVVMGCSLPVLLIPLYSYLVKKYTKAEETLMEHRDKKSSVLTEAVQGIRQIKFDALEEEWHSKISKLRRTELQLQSKVYWLELSLIGMWSFGPICMSVVALIAYTLINGTISSSVAFTSIAIFQGVQYSLGVLPEAMSDFLNASISARRIGRFLALPSHQDERQSGDSISFRNASITWPLDESEDSEGQFRLGGLDCDIPSGKLTLISGRSGAGKSLLLQAIIGEAEILDGTLTTPPYSSENTSMGPFDAWSLDGSMAYVAQEPWIENMNFRDGILFGLPFNRSRYNNVLDACGLVHDIETFPDGDKTDIGANGINLSGGQKWRLSLARALYSRASILVLDDIFSAVDAHVGNHLFQRALTGRLSRGRTRILATHHIQRCLDGAAYCVILENGQMLGAGPPDTLIQDGSLEAVLKSKQPDDIDRSGLRKDSSQIETSFKLCRQSTSSFSNPKRRPSLHESQHPDLKPRDFYEEEKRETGAVKLHIVKTYAKACGGYLHWVLIIFLFVLTLLDNLAVPYWISIWTASYEENSATRPAPDNNAQIVMSDIPISEKLATRNGQADQRLIFYVGVYMGLSVLSWVLDLVRARLVFQGSIRASHAIFEQFLTSILRAPMSFLDNTPVGRILNRFTADFGVVDSNLAMNLSQLLHSSILVLGVIAAALLSSLWIVGFGLLSILASWKVASIYVTGAREAKRLESTARSPIIEHVGSILTGLATIRASGKESDYLDRLYGLIDSHCQSLYHRYLFGSWMAFWLSMVGAVFVTGVAVMFVGIPTLSAPLAGFALSFALEMSDTIDWMLQEYTQLEVNFNAVERIHEYTNIKQEPQTGIDVPAAWPTKGEIEISDLHVKYAPHLPTVLNGLNFTVQGGQRVGIVGRTGAGKSSLSLVLMRFLEPQSGSIHIDGFDIGKMRLHDVRSRVGIISQDPTVFAGTVREVLDPFGQHDDNELLYALEKVTPAASNDTTSGRSAESPDLFSLTSYIAEGGRNLSQGQRQLLCLARAIVSRPKILIMDEATASIDMDSDAQIQRSIREDIHDCTLLVIAHRLSTVADFDRILVLDKGQVAEYDSPAALVKKENGIFKSMVEQSGEKEGIEQIIFGERS